MARKSLKIFVPLDENYPDNVRIIHAGEAAELLYIRGLCLVKRLLSDGYIDAVQLPRLGLSNVEERVQRLVDVGLWERMPAVENRAEAMGYVVVGWLERNDTAEEIVAKRQKKIDAGTKGGIQSGKSRRKSPKQPGHSSNEANASTTWSNIDTDTDVDTDVDTDSTSLADIDRFRNCREGMSGVGNAAMNIYFGLDEA